LAMKRLPVIRIVLPKKSIGPFTVLFLSSVSRTIREQDGGILTESWNFPDISGTEAPRIGESWCQYSPGQRSGTSLIQPNTVFENGDKPNTKSRGVCRKRRKIRACGHNGFR